MEVDITCDMKCPFHQYDRGAWCCRGCATERAYFADDNNRHLWTEGRGFLGDQGCKLSRENMPPECKAYSCKQDRFDMWEIRYQVMEWNGKEWVPYMKKMEVGRGNIRTTVFKDLIVNGDLGAFNVLG